MVEIAGVSGFLRDEIFFTEQKIQNVVQDFGQIKVRGVGQNKGPGHIKGKLAEIAKSKGANAVMLYKCDQKSHKWWEQVFTLRWDSECWHGEGIAVKINK